MRAAINDQVGWYVERVMWVNVCRGDGLWEEVGYMGTSGNRDCQLASRSVLKDLTDDAFTFVDGSLFQTRRRVK